MVARRTGINKTGRPAFTGKCMIPRKLAKAGNWSRRKGMRPLWMPFGMDDEVLGYARLWVLYDKDPRTIAEQSNAIDIVCKQQKCS